MISETEQTLLLLTAAIITFGTLTVIIWQWWRGRGKRD